MKHISDYLLVIAERNFCSNNPVAIKKALPRHGELSQERVNWATTPSQALPASEEVNHSAGVVIVCFSKTSGRRS